MFQYNNAWWFDTSSALVHAVDVASLCAVFATAVCYYAAQRLVRSGVGC